MKFVKTFQINTNHGFVSESQCRCIVLKRKRAFIGPLGDDIPSIFPIVAGMLLFISTILYANAQVDSRNIELRQRQATQELAYLATQKAAFQPGEFKRICDNSIRPFAENNGLKFAVVVKRFCGSIDLENSNHYNELPPLQEATAGEPRSENVCTNSNEQVKNDYLTARIDRSSAPTNAIVLIYPFTVPCPEPTSPINGLGTLNVIVWR